MGRVTFAATTGDDIAELARDMRAADRDEIVAAAGPDVLETLRLSVAASVDSWAARTPEGLLCIFGTAAMSLTAREGSPWMLGTPLLDRHRRSLIKTADAYIRGMLRVFPVLANHVDARNAASIKRLGWLGFEFGEPEPYGVQGLPFRRFERREGNRSCVMRERQQRRQARPH